MAAGLSCPIPTDPRKELVSATTMPITNELNRVIPMPLDTKLDKSPEKMSAASEISIITVRVPEFYPATILGKRFLNWNSTASFRRYDGLMESPWCEGTAEIIYISLPSI